MIYSSPKIKSWLIASLEENHENKALMKKIANAGHASFLSLLNESEEFLSTAEWLHQQHNSKRIPLAFLAEKKSASAAFLAAANAPADTLISTLICINANFDELDENNLNSIYAPILLLINDDPAIIRSNEEAAQFIPYCEITLVQKDQTEQMEKLICKWLDHYAIARKKRMINLFPELL